MDAISSRTEEGAADAGEGLGTGLPWPEGAELSDGHAWAGRTRVRSLQGGYFQPLRSAREATLQKKCNTTQAALKPGSHYYNPQRSLHRTERGGQHRPTVDAW